MYIDTPDRDYLDKRLKQFPDICPRCNNDLEDLSGVALNIARYKLTVGKCFIFENGKTLDCRSNDI